MPKDASGIGLVVSADADRLQQVVWNLMTNAVKFTPDGGHVELRVERVDETVRIIVRDSGKGIAAEFLPFVFDRFRQADASSSRRHGGLGLGLAIVRELVDLHGGSVRADSAGEGQGSTFTVELPLLSLATAPLTPGPGGADQVQSRSENGRPLEGLTVLIVEDDAATQRALTWVLESSGATVASVPSADAALDALQSARPDVLVSDIGLPDADGYDLVRQIQRSAAQHGQPPLPALALTAYAHAADRELALAAGFQEYAAKPVEPKQLVRLVAGLCGR